MKKSILIILLLIAAATQAFSQKSVQGVVTDKNGLPLIGVNILVKGASKGTITDLDGKFNITGVKSADVLVFRYLGFETQELKVAAQQKINVTLEASNVQLQEMVVVGYGTSRKIDLTGSVASIDVQDLSKTATTNFDQALAGRVSGVQVTSTDGTPGEALNIVIRGGNSITGSNAPLYVVDGIPMETFDPASISTRDIKSFDILKDASATAIYGSRGANGVIVITTNSGSNDGKTEVAVHVGGGAQYIRNRLEVLSPYEYVKYLQNIAFANDNYVVGTGTTAFNSSWVDPELYRNVKGTSWQDEIFQTAVVQDYNFSISGGTKKGSFYYSGSYLKQPGTLINTSFQKLNNRLKFSSIISDALSVNAQMTYSHSVRAGLQISGNSVYSIIRDAVQFRPVDPPGLKPIEEDDENIFADPYQYNPVKSLMNTDQKRTDDAMSGNIQLQYKFLKNFTLNITGNYLRNLSESSLYYSAETLQAIYGSDGISGSLSRVNSQSLTNSNTLRYNTKIGKNYFEGLVGNEIQNGLSFASSLRNTKLPTDAFGIYNLGVATGSTIATTYKSENALFSYFGRLNFNYGNRYLATMNFRADGSSKFQEQNRWGYFPSFSTAWRISEESFMKNIDQISNMKVRLGWGVTGNNRIGDFKAYNLMSVSSSSGYVLGTGEVYVPGAFQSNMAVPDLRWEVTSQYNAGFDFGFFNSRINGTIDYYLKRTKDLLLDAQMAPSTGFLNVQQNVGEVQNSGIELAINTVNFKSKKFSWNSSFNISFNKNKTVKLNSGQDYLLIDPKWNAGFCQTEYQYITKVGQPVGMIYGLEFDGLYQMDDFTWTNAETYHPKPTVSTYAGSVHPGLAKYKDQLTEDTNNDGIPDKGDGIIDDKDRTIIGNPLPKHIGGFSNDIKYQNFDLQFMFQWSYGFDILNANRAEFGTPNANNSNRNGFKELTDIWTPTNTNTNVSGIRYNGNNLNARFGYHLDSRYIDDGSYLKLKSVVLGYNLPKKVLSKLQIMSCRISVAAQNLMTWTKYSGYDPDVSVGRQGALTPSLDYSAYPQSVAVSAGIDIKF
jgi:TonB-linked SusC/RagA family outer membrane protein